MKQLGVAIEAEEGCGVNSSSRFWDKAFYVLFVVFTALVLVTVRDYGYSWDEVWQGRWYGAAVIRFITSMGRDLSATTEHNFYLYGGTFDVLAELLVKGLPVEPRNARHLANAVAGLVGIWGVRQTARFVGGPAVGFWAALFLAVSSPWYGHMFINPKDVPFAAGYIWSLYFLLRIVAKFPSSALRDRLWLGVVVGMTLGVRIGGLLIFAYGLWLGLVWLAVLVVRQKPWSEMRRSLGLLARQFLPVIGLAWLLMVVCWPAALLSPLSIPLEAYRSFAHFQGDAPVLWCGREIMATQLPWTYLPVIFGVQLPSPLVVLVVFALCWSGWRVLVALRAGDRNLGAGLGLLLLAALFPPLWAIVNDSTLYDNGRHFLFVLPPLFCIAAIGWQTLLDCVAVRHRLASLYLLVLLLGSLVFPVCRMAALHPYEYAFLNAFAGGMPAGGQKFDTEYWITSYREAAFAVISHARKVAVTAGVPFEAMPFTVAIVGPPQTLEGVFPENFTVLHYRQTDRADYFIATTRWHNDTLAPTWSLLSRVERLGMTFAVVKVEPGLARIN